MATDSSARSQHREYAAFYDYPSYEADRGTRQDRANKASIQPHSIQPAPSPLLLPSPALPYSPSGRLPSFGLPVSPPWVSSVLPSSAAPPADEQPPPLSFLFSPSLLPSVGPMWTQQTVTVPSPLPPARSPPAPPAPAALSGLPSLQAVCTSAVSSEEELLLSRRQKQRRADIQRRRREAAALDELRQLMTAAEAYTSSGSAGSGGGPVKESGGWEEEHKRQQQRVEVLESSSQSMRQLLQMVQALKQHCDEQQEMIDRLEADRQLDSRAEQQQRPSPSWPSEPSYAAQSSSAPAKRLHLLSSAVSRSLDASLGSGALHSASFLPVTLAAVLIDCRTGTALDVSDGFIALAGWERPALIGAQVTQNYDSVISSQWSYVGPTAPAQYARSKRMKRELYSGFIDVCVVRWRLYLADLQLYEVQSTTWIDGWETVIDAHGRSIGRRPLRAVGVMSMADTLRMDQYAIEPALDVEG